MAAQYYGETLQVRAAYDYRSAILSYLGEKPVAESTVFYVPYFLVPTIHLYHPELSTIGYDTDWSPGALAVALSGAGSKGELLCAQSTCNAVRREIPAGSPVREAQVAAAGIVVNSESGQEEPLYSLIVDRH